MNAWQRWLDPLAAEVGDVHLTWENEALREVTEAKGGLLIVYPPVSILAEPHVAWVDAAVARNDTLAAARAFLSFLVSDTAQQTIARLGYRPWLANAPVEAGVHFPALTLVPVTAIGRDWDDVADRFFVADGIIDASLGSRPR